MVNKKYQYHLDRVSRSFAKSIASLEGDLKHNVGLSYIICRIIDTIEDDPLLTKAEQKKAFRLLSFAIKKQSAITDFYSYISKLNFSNPDEEKLMMDSSKFLEDLHSLPEKPYKQIRKLSLRMIGGMRHFLETNSKGKIKIHTLAELNTYCFYVAGIVGECLTNLVAINEKSWKINLSLKKKSHTFGLYLQKINILKDQLKDEREGRYFVPNRREVYDSLCSHATEAYEYILQIPKGQKAYKIFCLSAFLLGLHTIRKLDPLQATENPKVSRLQMLKLYSKLDTLALSDEELQQYVLSLIPNFMSYKNTYKTKYLNVSNGFVG